MIVRNEELLDQFREAWTCEICGKPARDGCDPCHVYAKGMGGGRRLDIRYNLVSGHRWCHRDSHDGKYSQEYMLGLVAKREGVSIEQVRRIIERHLRGSMMNVRELPVEQIEVDGKVRGSVDDLKESILRVGLLHPIGVSTGMKVVFGRRRFEACKELGYSHVPAVVVDDGQNFSAAYHENVNRLDFTNEEKLAYAEKMSEAMQEAGLTKREADDIAGKKAGIGGRENVRKARAAKDKLPEAKSVHAASVAAKAANEKFAVDALGKRLPPEYLELFDDNFYATAVSQLRAIAKAWVSKSSANPYLLGTVDKKTIGDQIELLTEALTNAQPHVLCLSCHGKLGCEDCRKSGWMPHWTAKEYRDARRRG